MGDLISGDGWISDESEFYGTKTKKRKLEKQSTRVNILHLIREWQKVQALNPVAVKIPDQPHVQQQLYNQFEGLSYGRQLSETIPEFIKRMHPLTSGGDGAWIWIANPIGKGKRKPVDVDGLAETGFQLIDQFRADRDRIERENLGKAQSTITKKLNPYRDTLKEHILDTAIKHNVTSGKWMLFPTEEDVTRTWRTLCEAIIDDKLGDCAKVAVEDHSRNPDSKTVPRRLICVYTRDFSDLEDVRRVLDELVDLGLAPREGNGIYYKCDAYTYLGIESDNAFKIKASLYSSRELFKMSVPAKATSSIAMKEKKEEEKKNGELDGWVF